MDIKSLVACASEEARDEMIHEFANSKKEPIFKLDENMQSDVDTYSHIFKFCELAISKSLEKFYKELISK